MAKDTGRAEPRQAGHVCPVCKQPVETVIKRRKVLGAYVPTWGPGPCRHADCSARVDEDTAKGEWKPTRSARLNKLSQG
ncbi:hypothetical protein ACFQVC_11775 [Streptomyces monticola]|uniref:Uncharacterized protein n=1 Tax=Streptomyces monticola TaxID=2666263 RepID=A0ABW2JH70_9ACTN